MPHRPMRTAFAVALAYSWLLAISALMAMFVAAAGAWAGCPTAGGWADGCAGANPNGAFRISGTLYDFAARSGQNWVGPHPWPWNAVGVDYPGGYDKTLTLKDPAAIIPAECSLGARAGLANAVQLYCTQAAGTTLTVSGYDFCLHGGMELQFRVNNAASISVHDNRFCNGPGTSIGNGALILVQNAGPSVDISRNSFAGNGSTYPAGMTLVTVTAPAASVTARYNDFHDIPGRAMTANAKAVAFDFNWIDGLNTAAGNGLHGEVGLPPAQNPATYEASFNVVVFTPQSQANTTAFYCPGPATRALTCLIRNNIVVSNRTIAGAASVSALVAEYGGAAYPDLEVTGNYGDATGALLCLAYPYGGAPPVYRVSGNISLRTGQPIDGVGITAASTLCR